MGQKYAKDADRPVWRKSVHFRRARRICPRQSGTVGTKVHRGHGEPKGPRANGNVPRVFASKRDREARIGRIGEIYR
ncbi:hypothetical protein KI387_029341, partial [Taxus chinensis]